MPHKADFSWPHAIMNLSIGARHASSLKTISVCLMPYRVCAQVQDTLAEIEERGEAVRELEKSLLEPVTTSSYNRAWPI